MIVIPTLTGGLGNRLFQLATAIAYGEQHNRTVVLHDSLVCDNPYEDKERIYEMVPHIQHEYDPLLLQHATTLKEEYPLRPSKSQVVILEGIFKDQRYFESSKLEHFPMFPTFLDPREDLEHTIFLHFKRNFPLTSYYRTALKRFFPDKADKSVCSPKAVNQLALINSEKNKRIPENKKIFLFCEDNDMPWLVKNLEEFFPFVKKEQWILQPPGLRPIEVLWLMTRCQGGAICANSSLSWWGAYLGSRVASAQGAEAPCYFPAKWFRDNCVNILPKWGKILIV